MQRKMKLSLRILPQLLLWIAKKSVHCRELVPNLLVQSEQERGIPLRLKMHECVLALLCDALGHFVNPFVLGRARRSSRQSFFKLPQQ